MGSVAYQGKKIGNHIQLQRKIGEGAYGEVYKAINTKKDLDVAVKCESNYLVSSHLIFEGSLYKQLHQGTNGCDKGIPNIYISNQYDDYKYLVLDLLGPSLASLFCQSFRKFSLKTVLMIVDQLLQIIEYVHSRNIVHRDIKPNNLCIGLNKKAHKIFLIDFGLANIFRYGGSHISYCENNNFIGTARYASINSHLGIEQARRDDLESLGYVVMQFLRGQLPWQSYISSIDSVDYERVLAKKQSTSVEVLCKGYPIEFAKLLYYARNLDFQEKPDYLRLKKMFKNLFNKQGYQYDYKYDWNFLIKKKYHYSLQE